MLMYPNLKLQLWKCGMRQQQLARMLDIHESLLSKVVNGFREPSPELRQRIADALQCDISWLFERAELPGRDAH
jgi:transcriptional regulator with XRE-family HTH domain